MGWKPSNQSNRIVGNLLAHMPIKQDEEWGEGDCVDFVLAICIYVLVSDVV